MGQLAQWVVLIHELGQLGRTEKLFYRCRHRFDVDQGLRRDTLRILRRHAFTHHSFQTGKTDPVLILKQFAHRTDTAVAKVVDIVGIAKAILQMHVIVNGCQNVILRNVLRNQLGSLAANRFFQLFRIRILFHQLFQNRIIYQFLDAEFSRLAVHIFLQIHHTVGEHFDIAFLSFDPNERNRGILNLYRQIRVHFRIRFRDNLSGNRIHHILRQHLAADPVFQGKFFIEFITSYFCQVISSGVEKHTCDQALRALNSQRFARTDLFIKFQQTFLIALCCILCKRRQNLRFFTEQLQNLGIRAVSQCTDQHRNRHFTGSVNTDIEHIIGIRLILQPCSAVRNHGTGEQKLAHFVMVNTIVDTRGTYQLADDDTLRAVDHESSRLCHKRQITHENLMFVDLIRFLIIETNSYFQRSSVGGIPFFAFFDRVLCTLFVKCKVGKLQAQLSAVVGNRRNIRKCLTETFIQKPLVGISLNLDQIRHFQYFLFAGITHSDISAGFDRFDSVLFH